MKDIVTCVLASICALFFLFVGLDQAAQGQGVAAVIGVFIAVVFILVAVLAVENRRQVAR